MSTNKASKGASAAEENRTATAKRDAAFLADRRAKEAANMKRTMELRALRLAHQESEKARIAAEGPVAPKVKKQKSPAA